jgi:anti-sigma B factor antagonist
MLTSDPLVIERYAGAAHGHGVLLLKGPLTMENLPLFDNAVRLERSPTMILDLTHVPYIDSAGLGSLVTAYISGNKAGRRVALAGVNKRVRKLFEITRVEPLFLMFPTLGDALEAFSSAGEA